MTDDLDVVRALVLDVPDYPKPGILFKDLTPVLADPRAFAICIDRIAERFAARADAIVGIESRGFIFGAAVAARMALPFVPVRKPGKLPRATDRVEYALEYGHDAVEMHRDALRAGARVVIVDDVIATGGTAAAACELVHKQEATVAGCAFVLELGFLKGAEKLAPAPVYSVLRY